MKIIKRALVAMSVGILALAGAQASVAPAKKTSEDKTLFFIIASFGTEGSAQQAVPREQSVADATEIYNSLDVDVKDGKKSVTIQLNGEDAAGIVCVTPKKGITEETAWCDLYLLAYGVGEEMQMHWDENLEFKGPMAQMIYEKLNVEPVKRTGATTKVAGNLRCMTSRNAGGPFYRCNIEGVVGNWMSTDALIRDGAWTQKEVNELKKQLGL